MFRILLTATLLLASNAAFADADESKVNGDIAVMQGKSAGNLDTVNGSIMVGDKATIQSAETVNGSIAIGTDVKAASLSTVNGRIDVGNRSRVEKGIEAVNGTIVLRDAVEVGGNVENVNGNIGLAATRVGGQLKTTSGNISIGVGAHVGGGVLVEKPSGWFNGNKTKPRVVIGPQAVVEGTLEFRRDVELLVSESATIGTVKGAKATRFSGDTP